MKQFCSIFIIFFSLGLFKQPFAQSLTGTTGYYNIPSADFFPDKTVYFGFNRANKKYQDYADGEYNLNIYYANITFLKFLEVGLRYTRLEGFDPPDRQAAGDRMVTIRVQPVSEGKYYPSVVLGFQNFLTSIESGAASHFNSTYIVVTKNFEIKQIIKIIGVTLGYGSDILKSSDYQFIGIFGGVRLVFKTVEFIDFLMEYDANKWNVGTRITFFKHLSILAGFEGLNAFSGGVSYRFRLP
jgi:hypothetical protein